MPNNFSRDILSKKSKAELLDLAMEHFDALKGHEHIEKGATLFNRTIITKP